MESKAKITEAEVVELRPSGTQTAGQPATEAEAEKKSTLQAAKDKISPIWPLSFFAASILLAASDTINGAYFAFAAGFFTLFFMRGKEFNFGVKNLSKEITIGLKTSAIAAKNAAVFTKSFITSFVPKENAVPTEVKAEEKVEEKKAE